jgi:methyl-accepting chemotaxis protein
VKRFLRRRKMIVDTKLQFRLLLVSLGYLVFYISVLTLALFVPLMFQLNAAGPNTSESLETATSILYLHQHFWPISLLSLVVIVLHSILTSHRIAGPLFRIRRVVELVRDGTIPGPARLRKGDLLQPEMRLVNEMLESLQHRIETIYAAQETLAGPLADITRRAASLADPELSHHVEKMATQIDQFSKSVHSLKKEE